MASLQISFLASEFRAAAIQSCRLRRQLEESWREFEREVSAVDSSVAVLHSGSSTAQDGLGPSLGLQTLPVSPPPRNQEPLNELTPREIQVLRLIGEGERTKIIAWKLGISYKTAVTHRSNIMEKLGIHEGPSLVRFAIRTGLSRA